MKLKKLLGWLVGTACSLTILSGCMAGMFEEEINVTFACEGDVIGTGSVTQFKNIQSPLLPETYVPTGYKFCGWTTLPEEKIDLENESHFKTQFIGGGKMVHYLDVKPYTVDHAATMNALILPKDQIPKEYHYFVLGWYNKPATSGVTEDKMNGFETMVRNYLTKEGVSEEDLATVIFKGYTGNVEASTKGIMDDNNVDIMFGWNTNISTTGKIPTDLVKQDEEYTILYKGTAMSRHVHRLSDSAGSVKVMQYIMSEEAMNYWNS